MTNHIRLYNNTPFDLGSLEGDEIDILAYLSTKKASKNKHYIHMFPGVIIIQKDGTLYGYNSSEETIVIYINPDLPEYCSLTDGVLTALGRKFIPATDGISWIELD